LEARMRRELSAAASEEFTARAFVDTGPVVERSLAVAAGMGWVGKNTCLIHPKLGSYGFLAVLLTSLEVFDDSGERGSVLSHPGRKEQNAGPSTLLPHPSDEDLSPGTPVRSAQDDKARVGHPAFAQQRDHSRVDPCVPRSPKARDLGHPGSELEKHPSTAQVQADRCGSCRRCIEACPTGALVAPYQMDARRCIAYLTIEHKGVIEPDLMAGMGRQVFGCDICQDVCPWNRKAPIGADPELEARTELVNPALAWLAEMDEREFERSFNGSPVRRAGFKGLLRNVAIAMGNSGGRNWLAWLEDRKDSADDGLRTAARWAIKKLRAADPAQR